jgi:uncharacterized membrane protein (Fun14 family)
MAEKRTIELEIQDNSKSLKAQYREAVQELQKVSAQYGETSEQAIKAAKAAADLKDQIGFSKDLVDSFNPDAKFNALSRSIGGVLDGFQAFEGAMGLIGVQGEQMQETMLKVQSAMALSQGVQGVMEAKDSLIQLGTVMKSTAIGQALLTAATAAYNFVLGASTTGLKLFRLALVSTGIGALVVGVGLLVANFDKIVDAVKGVIGWFSGLSGTMKNVISVIFPIVGVIRLVVMALEELGVIDNEQDKINAKNKENQRKRTEAELKQIEAVRKAREKNFNNEQAAYDREIKIQQALGKSTLELQKAKINASIKYQETKQKEIEAELLSMKLLAESAAFIDQVSGGAFTARVESLQNELDKTKNEIENQKTDLKILDIEAKKAQQPTGGGGGSGGVTPQEKTDIDVTRRVEDEKLRIREESRKKDLDSLALNYKRKLEDAEKELANDKNKSAKLAALEKQFQESIRADIKAIDDKWDKIEKDARDQKLQEQIKAEDEQYNALQQAQNSARDQELFELMQSYDAKFELAKNNAELEKALTDSFNKEQAAIIKKYRDEEAEKKKEEDEKEKARIKALNEFRLNAAKDTLQVISNLTELFSGKSEKQQKRAFQIQKAVNIASAVIDTYKAANSALASSPPPFNYIAMAAAITAGLLNVKKIASQQFQSSSSSGGGGGGGGSNAPAAAPMTANFSTIGSSGINQLAQLQQMPTQAYVVSGEVTSAQALDRNRVQNATL